MAKSKPAEQTDDGPAEDGANYTVVARRYRPKSFSELVGQDHISQALAKAIATNRVGHAYLFTGARGVGKTSSARIFAKALNVPADGPRKPDDEDVARAIDAGEDVDVIEIDAASNRGIDEIRRLRANVSVRPSRSRYKIYIIDEVHMLTKEAFNALLKTLEEPPEHVKFIFCTTDPEKVPITVLSRCQRFDFAPVQADAIQTRLKEICEKEGFKAEPEALAVLARRAAGSMRDSQSLLEQVMSFSSGTITAEQVHALLGTADESRLRDLAEALANRDGVTALRLVHQAISEGTDAGQFAEQMLSYLRDLMAVGVGGGPDLLKMCNPSGFDHLKQLSERWGLQTILSAVQLLDEALVRMRFSVQSQALFEVALIQITQLQDLATVAKILEAIQSKGPLPAVAKPARPAVSVTATTATPTPSSAAEKKNAEGLSPTANTAVESRRTSSATTSRADEGSSPRPTQASPQTLSTMQSANDPSAHATSTATLEPPSYEALAVVANDALSVWKAAAAKTEGMLMDIAQLAVAVECKSGTQWTIVFPPGAQKHVEYCEAGSRRDEMATALRSVAGRSIEFGFRVQPGAPVRTATEAPTSPAAARSQRIRQLTEHPFVSKVCEMLQGEIVRVDPPQPHNKAL